jgi:hypothetical protein
VIQFIRESARINPSERVTQMNKTLAYIGRYGGQQWTQAMTMETDDVFDLAREIEKIVEEENDKAKGK